MTRFHIHLDIETLDMANTICNFGPMMGVPTRQLAPGQPNPNVWTMTGESLESTMVVASTGCKILICVFFCDSFPKKY